MVRTSGTRQEGGGHTCGFSLTEARTRLLALTQDNQPTKAPRPSPLPGTRTAGAPVGPETETGVLRVPTLPHETHGTPKGRDKAPAGEPPGLSRDGPR